MSDNMVDFKTINSFLQRTDLSDTEKVIKDQLVEIDAGIKKNLQEREQLNATLKAREEEYLRLTGAFEAELKLVQTLATSRKTEQPTNTDNAPMQQ